MRIYVKSFGLKYGGNLTLGPGPSAFVFDLRMLQNPHNIPELRYKRGTDQEIIDNLEKFPSTEELFRDILNFIYKIVVFAKYYDRTQLIFWFSCYGGHHRSVYFAEKVGEALKKFGYEVLVEHRDLYKD